MGGFCSRRAVASADAASPALAQELQLPMLRAPHWQPDGSCMQRRRRCTRSRSSKVHEQTLSVVDCMAQQGITGLESRNLACSTWGPRGITGLEQREPCEQPVERLCCSRRSSIRSRGHAVHCHGKAVAGAYKRIPGDHCVSDA